MKPVRLHLRRLARLRVLAAFCLAGAAAGVGLYFASFAHFPSGDSGGAMRLSQPSDPAYTITTPPARVGSFARNLSLEQSMKVSGMVGKLAATMSGQPFDLQSAVYTSGAPGNQQVFVFVGGDLANDNAAASIASFKKSFPGAEVVPTGTLGGQAACGTMPLSSDAPGLVVCAWCDKHTFGTLMSPTMTQTMLANTMVTTRHAFERPAKQAEMPTPS